MMPETLKKQLFFDYYIHLLLMPQIYWIFISTSIKIDESVLMRYRNLKLKYQSVRSLSMRVQLFFPYR